MTQSQAELEKQARELEEKAEEVWANWTPRDARDGDVDSCTAVEFAAYFAAQVREQSIAECVKVIPKILSIQEAAKALRRPVATLRYWRATGRGPTVVKIEGCVGYDEADLIAYIEANRAAPPSTSQGQDTEQDGK